MLARLATHYHRPDFGPAQVKLMILDFIEDLSDYTVAEIEIAVRDYRRNPENKFFPKTADLRETCTANRKERASAVGGGGPKLVPQFGESRPMRWWDKPKQLWRSHWREEEIPEAEQATYYARKAKLAARPAA